MHRRGGEGSCQALGSETANPLIPTGPGGEAGQAGTPAKAKGARRGEVGIGALDPEAKPWQPLSSASTRPPPALDNILLKYNVEIIFL